MRGFDMFANELGGDFVMSPLSVPVSKNKKFILNLNNYRNTHYQALNKAKINYKAEVYDQIKALPEYQSACLTLTLYPQSKRKVDIDNVCSIHSKFFLDAIVELGKLPDDNHEYVKEIIYQFGAVSKENPRVSIQIRDV